MVKGSDPSTCARARGRSTARRCPGVGGTTAIAGHRTTYLARLSPHRPAEAAATASRSRCPTGRSPTASSARGSWRPTRWRILRDVGYDRLVLSACHPLFSAAQRIVVVARLTSVVPLRAARAGQGSEFGARPLTPRRPDPMPDRQGVEESEREMYLKELKERVRARHLRGRRAAGRRGAAAPRGRPPRRRADGHPTGCS